MLNKKVLLGALVAGAMVLPMTASAGIVSGQCVNCHTMHNSQNNASMNGGALTDAYATLLKGGGCEGCHAVVGEPNLPGVGKGGAATYNTPQVDDPTYPNLAGFFTRAAADQSKTHNIPGDLTGQGNDTLLPVSPGMGVTNETCVGCHDRAAGGHHGQGGAAYRMLFVTTNDVSSDSTFGSSTTPGTVTVQNTQYDSDEMNNVCAGCHGLFHAGDNRADQYDSSTSPITWVRHPTDLRLVDQIADETITYNYNNNWVANADGAGTEWITPLGRSSTVISGTPDTLGSTQANTLMCITCHFSHGSANNDLLRFAYDATNTLAGDNQMDPGCEYCHSYGLTGFNQDGM